MARRHQKSVSSFRFQVSAKPVFNKVAETWPLQKPQNLKRLCIFLAECRPPGPVRKGARRSPKTAPRVPGAMRVRSCLRCELRLFCCCFSSLGTVFRVILHCGSLVARDFGSESQMLTARKSSFMLLVGACIAGTWRALIRRKNNRHSRLPNPFGFKSDAEMLGSQVATFARGHSRNDRWLPDASPEFDYLGHMDERSCEHLFATGTILLPDGVEVDWRRRGPWQNSRQVHGRKYDSPKNFQQNYWFRDRDGKVFQMSETDVCGLIDAFLHQHESTSGFISAQQ